VNAERAAESSERGSATNSGLPSMSEPSRALQESKTAKKSCEEGEDARVKNHHGTEFGVCSWSLRPTSPRDLAAKVATVGVNAVQLALDPIRTGLWGEIETVQALRTAGIEIISGMMAMAGEDYSSLETIRKTGGVFPDEMWGANIIAARANARLARRLGICMVTFHAGFIPHEEGDERAELLDRLRSLADVFDDCGVRVALETGQENAETLLDALRELDRMGGAQIGINFDPANMILYGMGDPIEAVGTLADRIVQIHIKDARPTTKHGTWGTEVAVGSGTVDWSMFFDALAKHAVRCDCLIERESGERREADITTARKLIEKIAWKMPTAKPRRSARAAATSVRTTTRAGKRR